MKVGVWLQQGYYLNASAAHRLRLSLIFSLFVFLFLVFFKPFGLIALGAAIYGTAASYAALTFVSMLLLNVALPALLPRFFNEEKWTVGKELFYNVLNVGCIGLANAVYSIWRGFAEGSVPVVCMFLLYTVCVALFPITVSVLLKERTARKLYQAESDVLSADLHTEPMRSVGTIVLQGQNNEERLEVQATALLVLCAADNYVEVWYLGNAGVQKQLLRNTLKIYQEQLQEHTNFWRCHKSYIVNLSNVVRVSGNAQGFKLHVSGFEQPVPVSRNNNALLKSKIKV